MPNDFKSLDELAKYITKNQLKQAMKNTGETVREKTKENVDRLIYDANTPEMYERTYELKNSLIATEPIEKNDGEIIVKIEHDNSLIHAYSPNQHMSVVDGRDVTEDLPYWINNGIIGHVFGQGFWTKPRKYMDETVEEMKWEDTFPKELAKELNKQGIKTSK